MTRRAPKIKVIVEKWKPLSLAFLPLLIAAGLGWYWHQDAEAVLDANMVEARQSTDAGLVETDAKGVITNANANMYELTGYTRSELIGMDLKSIMVPQARSKHPENMEKIEKAMTIVRCSLLMKDGKENRVVVVGRIGSGKYIASITREDMVIDHFSVE